MIRTNSDKLTYSVMFLRVSVFVPTSRTLLAYELPVSCILVDLLSLYLCIAIDVQRHSYSCRSAMQFITDKRSRSAIECRLSIEGAPVAIPFGAVSKPGDFLFSPRRPSSLSCVNEYLAIDSVGNTILNSSNCSMPECLPEKSSWCRNDHIRQRLTCNALRATRTIYLYYY